MEPSRSLFFSCIEFTCREQNVIYDSDKQLFAISELFVRSKLKVLQSKGAMVTT